MICASGKEELCEQRTAQDTGDLFAELNKGAA